MNVRRQRRGGTVLTAEIPRNTFLHGAAIAGMAVLLAILGPRPSVAAEGVALGYEGYLGGLHMMTAQVELASSDTAYRMETRANGRGIVGWLFSWTSNAVTEGVVGPDGALKPRWHERDIAQRGRKAKAIQIEYREDGMPMVARMRVGGEANFKENPHSRGTLDPMSAVMVIVDQMAAGATCSGEFPVFDGKWRYDVTAKLGDPKSLKGNKYMMYKGEAARCDLVMKAVDGFEETPRRNPRDEDSPRDDDTLVLTMWFANPSKDMPSVPVLATADTDYGGLRIYLARAENATISTEGKRAEAR